MIKNLTHDEVVEIQKSKPYPIGKIIVESNPFGEGGEQELWFTLFCNAIDTSYYNQEDINGINYVYYSRWKTQYTGTFTYIDPFEEIREKTIEEAQYQKPEVLEVGTKVEILENVKEVRRTKSVFATMPQTGRVGEYGSIAYAFDEITGVFYRLKFADNAILDFPHYCVRPIQEEQQITITIGNEMIKIDKSKIEDIKKLIEK